MNGTNRKHLQWASDRIESVLALHRIPARVTGGTVTPRWIRFQVLPAVGAKISKIKGLNEEMAAALDTHTCRVSRRGAAVAVEVPRTDPLPVTFHKLHRQLTHEHNLPPATAMLGLAHDGTPLLIRLPSPDVAHILIAGTTGSGKTVLMQSMAASLALNNRPQDLALLFTDPKAAAFQAFDATPHLPHPVVSDPDDITDLLHRLIAVMLSRSPLHTHPPIALFIDELADIAMTSGQPALHAITRLTQRGREAGIHVIAATQKPSAALLGSLIKANFPVRIVGKVTSTDDARVATGWPGTGAEHFAGRGDFGALAEGQLTRFQAPYISPTELAALLLPLKTATPNRALVQQFQLPPPTPDPDPDLDHARQLTQSPLWPNRWADDTHTEYTRGWLSKACHLLFDRNLEGTWYHQTTRIVAMAEQLNQSSTSTTAPTRAIDWPISAYDR